MKRQKRKMAAECRIAKTKAIVNFIYLLLVEHFITHKIARKYTKIQSAHTKISNSIIQLPAIFIFYKPYVLGLGVGQSQRQCLKQIQTHTFPSQMHLIVFQA